jgi:hypothetical protein
MKSVIICAFVIFVGRKIKEHEIGRICSLHGEIQNSYKILVGKPQAKEAFGRFKYRWEDNIKIDFRVVWCEGVDWTQLLQGMTQ